MTYNPTPGISSGSQGLSTPGIPTHGGANSGGGGGATPLAYNRFGQPIGLVQAKSESMNGRLPRSPVVAQRGRGPQPRTAFAAFGIPAAMQMPPTAIQQQVQQQANVNTVTPSAAPSFAPSQSA